MARENKNNTDKTNQVPQLPPDLVSHISYVDITLSASNIFRKLKKNANIYFVLKAPINLGKFKGDGSWENVEMLGTLSGVMANGGLFVQAGAAAGFADATAVIGIASYIHKKAAETHQPTPGYRELFCSEVFKKTPYLGTKISPSKFRVGLYELCGGDLNKKFLIELYHHRKVGSSLNLGSLNISINDLRKQSVYDVRVTQEKGRQQEYKVGAKLYFEMATSAPIDIPKEYLYSVTITPPDTSYLSHSDLSSSVSSLVVGEPNGASPVYPSYCLPSQVHQVNGKAQLSQSLDNTSMQQHHPPPLPSHHLSYPSMGSFGYQQQSYGDAGQQKVQVATTQTYSPQQYSYLHQTQYQQHYLPQPYQYAPYQYNQPNNYYPTGQ